MLLSTQGLANWMLSQHSNDMHATCILLICCTAQSSTASPHCFPYQICTKPLSSMGSFMLRPVPIWAHYPKPVSVASPPPVPACMCGGPPASILPSPLHCPLCLALHSPHCHIIHPMIT